MSQKQFNLMTFQKKSPSGDLVMNQIKSHKLKKTISNSKCKKLSGIENNLIFSPI